MPIRPRTLFEDLDMMLNVATKQTEEFMATIEGMLARLQVDSTEKPTQPKTQKSMAGKQLSTACTDVLKRCTMTATTVTLPPGHLGTLYQEVKKVLEGAGGKWNKKQECFVFDRDPREQLGLALEMNQVVSTKKDTQAFYTPQSVVERVMAHYSHSLVDKLVLEPSAGSGAFANYLRDAGATVDCVEIDPVSAKMLREQGHEVFEEDFLKRKHERIYDLVVMNPPFTRGQDMKHVEHAFKFLAPEGVLLAVMSPHFTFASSNKAYEFKEFVAEYGKVVEELEAGAFAASGTQVRTVVVKLVNI